MEQAHPQPSGVPAIQRNGKAIHLCKCTRQVGHWRRESDGLHFVALPTTTVKYRADGTLVLRCVCGKITELKPRSEAA